MGAETKKILICVDDEEYVLFSLKDTLRRSLPEDYSIETAKSAEEAEAIIDHLIEQGEDVPVLVCDHIMPQKTGEELIIDLHKRHPKIKKIMLTGQASTQSLANILNQQCLFRFIPKPWDPNDLILTIEQAVRSYYLDQTLTEKNEALQRALFYHPETGFPNFESLIHTLKDRNKNFSPSSIFLIRIDSYSSLVSSFGMEIYNRILALLISQIHTYLGLRGKVYHGYQNEIVIFSKEEFSEFSQFIRLLRQSLKNDGIILDGMAFYLELSFSSATGYEDTYYKAKLAMLSGGLKVRTGIIEYNQENSIDHHIENYHLNQKIQIAFRNQKIVPFFQGIYSNSKKKIEKYECLARMQLQDENILTPDKFLPLTKSTGNLRFLGLSMVDASLAYFSKHPDLECSINVTESDLEFRSFPSWIEGKLAFYQIRPERVCFEVLEDINFYQHPDSLQTLQELKRLGCKISIDDFGIQNSNLARLLSIEPDYIKIDGSFIQELPKSERARVLVAGMVDLAHSIGAEVVAEFVSDVKIQEIVLNLGIEYSQGYYFMKPSPELSV